MKRLKNIFKPIEKAVGRENGVLLMAIVIGILVVLNFFSYQIFYRWDLTANKDYSISRASKQSVNQLDDLVIIKGYFSQELPSQYLGLRQEVGDILDEYQNYANGKIRVEFIDPKDNKELEQELQIKGIPQLQFNVLEKDKYQVVNGYLGILVQYGDKSEAIPVIQDTSNLEYQITSIIKKLTAEEMPLIGFATGNGALDPDKEISRAHEELSKIYRVESFDLSSGDIPAEVNTLIIAGPKEEFKEEQLKAIDAFLMRGGSILFLLDGVRVEKNLSAQKNDIGLDKLLADYGLKLNHDLVLDVVSGTASFNQGFITFTINYPFWPKITATGFDRDNAAVAKLESLILPWPSSIEVIGDKIAAGNKVSYLVKTSDKSWLESDNFNLNPQQPSGASGVMGQHNLAVSIFGKFNSAYGQGSTDQGRLILVSDSDFVVDNFLTGPGDNLVFFQNLVDSLSLDEELINIRSKGISDRPIKELAAGSKALVRYLNIFGLTVVVVGLGLIRYFLRRKSRFSDEL